MLLTSSRFLPLHSLHHGLLVLLSALFDFSNNPFFCFISFLDIITFSHLPLVLVTLASLLVLYYIGCTLGCLYLSFSVFPTRIILIPLLYFFLTISFALMSFSYSSWESLTLWIGDSNINLLSTYLEQDSIRSASNQIEEYFYTTISHTFFLLRRMVYQITSPSYGMHLNYVLYTLPSISISSLISTSLTLSVSPMSSFLISLSISLPSLPIFNPVAAYLACSVLGSLLAANAPSIILKIFSSFRGLSLPSSGLLSICYLTGTAPSYSPSPSPSPFSEDLMETPRRIPACSFRSTQSPYQWNTYKVGRGAVWYDRKEITFLTPLLEDIYLITLPHNFLPGWSTSYNIGPGYLINSLFWQISNNIYLHHHHSYVDNFLSTTYPKLPSECFYCISLYWLVVRSDTYIPLYNLLHDPSTVDWSYELELTAIRNMVFHPDYSDNLEYNLSPVYLITLDIINNNISIGGVLHQYNTASAPFNLPLSITPPSTPEPVDNAEE